jgi:hypothetical protein
LRNKKENNRLTKEMRRKMTAYKGNNKENEGPAEKV